MNREVEKALKKVTISHEMYSYQFNEFVDKSHKDYMRCINPEWENELHTIKSHITHLEQRNKELEKTAKWAIKECIRLNDTLPHPSASDDFIYNRELKQLSEEE